MCRKVLIHKNNRKYQRIFWRDSIYTPTKFYELNTVTYDTASATFLTIRCLDELATQNKDKISRNIILLKTISMLIL